MFVGPIAVPHVIAPASCRTFQWLLCAAAAVNAPAANLGPADVVTAQLSALKVSDASAYFKFASPSHRREFGTRKNMEAMVRTTPEFSMLLGCSRFAILSALSTGPDRWTCRIAVVPSEASLSCLDRAATVVTGEIVRVTEDEAYLERQFDTIEYQWTELMRLMAGQPFEVLCIARENCGASIVGLPSPDGSQDGVWYFPASVLTRDAASADDSSNDSSDDSSDDRTANGAASGADEGADDGADGRTVEFRLELSRRRRTPPLHELGTVVFHTKYGYRGVVVGYDEQCEQPDEWIEWNGVDQLPGGRQQYFYHVLVDGRDRPGNQATYVAEENLRTPDMRFTSERVLHPMVQTLLVPSTFDGDAHTYQPRPELRELYPCGVQGCWMVDSWTVDSLLPDDAQAQPLDDR